VRNQAAAFDWPPLFLCKADRTLPKFDLVLGSRTATAVLRTFRGRSEGEMVGILIHGNNHYILSGPAPSEAEALELARHWGVVQIGEQKSASIKQWEIREREFRENLEWAVVVPGEQEVSPAASELLRELAERGVVISSCSKGCW
jgi:hypothetical protein